MQFTTRKPTGRPSFPLILLAGVEGAGKTWAAVETTASDKVDRAFFIEIGESQADAYGAVPGADFEIIEHDGTLGQVRGAIQWAAQQPAADGKYNVLIVDSMTEVWTLLQDEAQDEANRRAKRKGKRIPDEGVRISMDLWNRIKDTWNGIVGQCRQFGGPVILTSRLELVTAVENGTPTGDKYWKIQSEKNLPFHCQVVMQARAPRQWTMTKIATTVPELQLQPGGEMMFKQFSVSKLLETMGIGSDAEESTFVTPTVDGSFDDEAQARKAAEEAERAAQAQREAEQKSFEEEQLNGLIEAERAGDLAKVEKALAYYSKHGMGNLVGIAQKIVKRLSEAQEHAGNQSMEQAQQAMQEELGAQPAPTAEPA